MSAPSRLSENDKRAIVAAYLAGEDVAEIARRYGIHHTYPCLIAKRAGCQPRRRVASKKRILVPPEIVEPVEIPIPSLADELGIKIYTHRVPNRSALTSSPIYDASAHREISLPFVSILARPA